MSMTPSGLQLDIKCEQLRQKTIKFCWIRGEIPTPDIAVLVPFLESTSTPASGTASERAAPFVQAPG